MRNAVLGTVAGLVIGTASALAYSHYFGDGALAADLQSQLDEAKATIAKNAHDRQFMAKETSGESSQVDELAASNEDLKKQLAAVKTAPAAAPEPVDPATLANVMMGMFRGAIPNQQRLFLLQSRLHLTADQTKAIQAAMDSDSQKRRALMRTMFSGGKVDPQAAAAANTLDQTLATVLTPQQQAAYQQVQADETTSRADTAATTQVNQVAPLLQLSDTQKDQVFNALYQVQISAPDPTTLLGNPNAPTLLAAQAQATQAALAKVLTPDQMALYKQQGQSLSAMGGGGRGGLGR